jgi:hypothetical protein
MVNFMRLVIIGILFLLYIPVAISSDKIAAPSIKAHYECLWWSESQMEDLDPNAPPPKKTVTLLDHWEYSDPVGVPHPEIVTLVAYIPEMFKGNVTVKMQWLKRKWSKPIVLKGISTSILEEGVRLLKADISVQEKIYKDRPTKLRSTLMVGKKSVKVLDLPIYIGD